MEKPRGREPSSSCCRMWQQKVFLVCWEDRKKKIHAYLLKLREEQGMLMMMMMMLLFSVLTSSSMREIWGGKCKHN